MNTFDFSGTVAQSNNKSVLIGDIVEGHVSYDPTQVGNFGNYVFTGSNKAHSFVYDVIRNGTLVLSDFFAAGGKYTITISIVEGISQMTIMGSTVNQLFVTIVLKANHNNGITLPTNMDDFNTGEALLFC